MANPNPQHNPTDGLGVAVAIHLSGTSGSSVVTALKNVSGAPPSAAVYPGVYTLTLSVGAAGGFASTITPTVALVDALNNVYSPVGSPRWRSYNNPSANSPAYFKPSYFNDGTLNYTNADNVASVNNTTGAITALKPGQAIIECAFPTFDNTLGTQATPVTGPGASIDVNQALAAQMIYVQIILTVIP